MCYTDTRVHAKIQKWANFVKLDPEHISNQIRKNVEQNSVCGISQNYCYEISRKNINFVPVLISYFAK
jgi:hypothetical protein